MDTLTAESKLLALKNILRQYGSVMIGFSGGVDSSFLLKVASQMDDIRISAATATSYIYPAWESNEAEAMAADLGIEYIKIQYDPINQVEGFAHNPKDRCYACKSKLFTLLKDKAKALGLNYVADGTNTDDMADYRPGLKAVKELGIKSPLLEAGLTKEEIRYLSKKLGLSTFSKPSFACLASRIPYGDDITREKLSMIEKAEDYMLSQGFTNVRVRCHGDIARIELDPGEMYKAFEHDLRYDINNTLKDIGFRYVSLDLAGYKMGSMNLGVDKENE